MSILNQLAGLFFEKVLMGILHIGDFIDLEQVFFLIVFFVVLIVGVFELLSIKKGQAMVKNEQTEGWEVQKM